jgi:phage tail sheath protein FI
MATTYLTPDIYIEEISSGSRPIEGVGTSTAAFVGLAPNASAHVNERPLRMITNWTQFVTDFAAGATATTDLAQAVYGFFQNGGTRCYVVNVGPDNQLLGAGGSRRGVELLEEIDDVAIVAAPGYTGAAAYDVLLSHCEKLKDRVAILDAPREVAAVDLLTKVAVAKPPAPRRAARDGGGDAPAPEPPDGVRARDSGYGAYYYPQIYVPDVFNPSELRFAPPSGHIAGIYARSDATRGVHKAPANEIVRGAVGVEYPITREEQGKLNPAGVNCIRLFATQGIRVWGARTMEKGEFRYVNVRRTFIMIEQSIVRSTGWILFEPNNQTLWKSIRRDVGAFLTLLWRQGALMGRTPAEAFFVKCDEETNPPEVIDAGMVVVVIGIAPVKPAEFVIFRIGQSASGATVETLTP